MSFKFGMPSNHLIFCLLLLLLPSIYPSIKVFSNESNLCIRWPKYWNFGFSISPSNEYSGLISFRMQPGCISLQSKGLLRDFSNSTAEKHQFFSTWPSLWSNCHMTIRKNIALVTQTFVGKVMSLLFNALSRCIIALLLRSKFF